MSLEIVPFRRQEPPWLPWIGSLNTVCFTLALLTYLGGFWGVVISAIFSQHELMFFLTLYLVGILFGIITGYLTNYECSFHDHSSCAL